MTALFCVFLFGVLTPGILQASKPCQSIQKAVWGIGGSRKRLLLDFDFYIMFWGIYGVCGSDSCAASRIGLRTRAAAGTGILTLIFQIFLMVRRTQFQRLDFPV